MTGAEVRVAGPDDVTAAGALTAEAYLADGLLGDDDGYTDELRDAVRRAAEAVLLVAVARAPDGREAVVGTITVAPYGSSYAEVAEPGEVELRMLAVAPEARGQGIAARLMRAAMREAVTGGARRVVLSTLDAMAAAQRLYARLGFRAEPERDWGHEEVRLHVFTWTPPEAPGVLVEAATWQPVRVVVTDDGWRAGISGGFTQRANSALPLGHPTDLVAAVSRVEAVYDEAGLPALFRVGAGAPADLAAVLSLRGYTTRSDTDVLVRDTDEPAAPASGVRVSDEPDDGWLRAWLGVKNRAVDVGLARAVLGGSPAHYLTVVGDGVPVATLRVAYTDEWAGLSCLAVAPTARRSGLGRALTRQGVALARRYGAARAFVQVEAGNTVASGLYGQLGFLLADGYCYLVGPGGADDGHPLSR